MPGTSASGGANKKRADLKLGNPTVAKGHIDHPDSVDRPTAQVIAEQPKLVFPDGHPAPLPLIIELWESMAVSGYNEFYTASDWAVAKLDMLQIDDYVRGILAGKGWTAMKSAEVRSMVAELLMTESSRRRLKIEVARHKDTPELAPVAPIDRARQAGVA